jgi:REP element-mobilizing transposase RayT
MPNHFHLFVKQTTHDYTIGKYIGDLQNSYTKYINKKYERSGVLFQGPAKTKIIENEDYFIWLFKYILENPCRANFVKYISDWEYSSARDYLGLRKGRLNDMEEISGRFSS